MENTPDIGGLISSLSANPALINMLSELIRNSGAANAVGQAQNTAFSAPVHQSDPVILSRHAPISSPQTGVNPNFGGIDPNLIGTLMSVLGQSGSTPPINEAKATETRTEGAQRTENGDHSRGGESAENILSRLLGGKTDSENRIRLLNALRPYLGEERREKLDLILKLLKLAELGHIGKLLSSVQ